MIGWRAFLLAALFLAYLFLAVLRAAAAALSPAALRRLLAVESPRRAAAAGDALGVKVAFDLAHHMTLIAGAILLVAAEIDAGVEHPYLASAFVLAAAILIGQIAGRLLAVVDPERAFTATWRIASRLYRPLDVVARPFFALLERLRLTARREWAEEEPEAAAEEITAIIDEGRQEGLFEMEEGKLIRQVVDFHDRVVREVMTPRTEIVAIRAEATLLELRDLMVGARHSRIPVYRGQIDAIEGIVFLKDLLACWGKADEGGPITPLVRPAHFVPETKQVGALLRELQARRTQIAIVVDEYGGTAGIATIEDLLEEIVGDIREEHDTEDREVTPEGEGRFLVKGSAPLDALGEALGADLEAAGYDTVSGLVFSALGRIPRAGESLVHEGVRLEIVKADSRRILLVRASRAAAPAARGG